MGKPGNRSITVRLDEPDHEYIAFLARELGMNTSEVIRELISRDRQEVERRALKGPLELTASERRVLRKVLSRL